MILSVRASTSNNPQEYEQIEFPGFSTGRRYIKFGFTITEIRNVSEIMIGSWFVKPTIPLLTILATVVGFPLASYFFLSQFSYFRTLVIVDGLLMLLFLVSYYRAIFDGPGYYPFYWALGVDNNVPDAFDESDDNPLLGRCNFDPPPAGIISNELQLKWARSQPRPPRSMVSRSARRIVIRPDHYCQYTQSWIGKRNFKFFILFNFYTVLFVGIILLCGVIVIYNDLKNGWPGLLNFKFFIHIALEFASVEFVGLSFGFLLVSLVNTFRGITEWERTNHLPIERFANTSKIKNIEDVMGPISQFYLYLSPFHSPWKNLSNDELVAGYNSYYE